MDFTIKDIRPFCLYKDKEIGLANNCFAADKFKETSGNEYITKVSGTSFGWIDNQGVNYRDKKFSFTRPTIEQILEQLNTYPILLEIAIKRGYIKESVIHS
jgi:hypothetical protein